MRGAPSSEEWRPRPEFSTFRAAGTETAPFTNYSPQPTPPQPEDPRLQETTHPFASAQFSKFYVAATVAESTRVCQRLYSLPVLPVPEPHAEPWRFHTGWEARVRPVVGSPFILGSPSPSQGPLPPPVPRGLPSLVGEEASQVGGCRFAREDGRDRDAPAQLVWGRKGGGQGGGEGAGGTPEGLERSRLPPLTVLPDHVEQIIRADVVDNDSQEPGLLSMVDLPGDMGEGG